MMHSTVNHYIQRDILRSLSRADGVSFSKLKPDQLENGIFSYHLKQLAKEGLIGKQGEDYVLTVEGVRYVASATRTNLDTLPQPKIFCFLIIENNAGEFIMHRRNAQPFMGGYTFPGGVLFYGEDLDELVRRQLLEKIGFETPVENRGIASLRLGKNDQILSHTYAHLFYGKVEGKLKLSAKDTRFTPDWVKPSSLPTGELLPDVITILAKIASTPDFFFLDLKIDE